MKRMYELRRQYPVLNDGWTLQELSNHVYNYSLPYSKGVNTTTGLWSVLRGRVEGIQDFSSEGTHGNQGVWLLYSNKNESTIYHSDCGGDNAIIAPYDANTTVKNLFYPFDEWRLNATSVYLGIEGSKEPNGCLPELNMTKYGWKAMVPLSQWTPSSPTITKFLPGHDARVVSNAEPGEAGTLDFEFRFSDLMDCDSFKNSFSVSSTTESGKQAHLDSSSLACLTIDPTYEAYYYGSSPSIWRARGTLNDVYDGIHVISVLNASNQGKSGSTHSNDHFTVRIGQPENPIVFPNQQITAGRCCTSTKARNAIRLSLSLDSSSTIKRPARIFGVSAFHSELFGRNGWLTYQVTCRFPCRSGRAGRPKSGRASTCRSNTGLRQPVAAITWCKAS